MADHYTLWDHGVFLRDERRLTAYSQALRSLLPKAGAVLDIGTGTGFFAVLAAKLGASVVDAVEPDTVITIARGVVEDNHVEDTVTLYQCGIHEFRSSRTYDVIISDLRGCVPYYGANLSAARFAQRLLASGGALIPSIDRTYVAPVCMPSVGTMYSDPWLAAPHGVDLSFCRDFVNDRLTVVWASPEELLASPTVWSVVDYREVRDTDHAASTSWRIERQSVMHGFIAWFESQLSPGVEICNRPGRAPFVYGQLFFPLPEAVHVAADEQVHLHMTVRAFDRESHRWEWTIAVRDHVWRLSAVS